MFTSSYQTEVLVGVHVGQKRETSAICVAECDERDTSGRKEYHLIVRHLERLSTGMPYPSVAERLGEVVQGVRRKTDCSVNVFIDLTGLGTPLLEIVRSRVQGVALTPVYFTHGDQRHEESGKVTLGKAHLVTRLQTLLQDGRIHLPKNAESARLADELLGYETHVTPDANDRHGAFKVGEDDDLVTALGLATQVESVLRKLIYRPFVV